MDGMRECWELKIWFKCALLKSAPGAPDKLTHNFFGRRAAFRHKIFEKSFMCFRYICVFVVSCLCWREWLCGFMRECWELKIWFKCALLKSAPDAPGAPDKLSHNFFGRHAAFRHKIYENSFMFFRYSFCFVVSCLCFMKVL